MSLRRCQLLALALVGLSCAGDAWARLPTEKGLPALAANGHLPPGMYLTSYTAFADQFGSTPERAALLARLRPTLRALQKTGVSRIYVGGSFVSDKAAPHDVDMLVPKQRGVDWEKLVGVARRVEKKNLHFYGARKIVTDVMKMQMTETQRNAWTLRKPDFVELFSQTRTGEQVGLAAIELSTVGPAKR